MQSVTDAIIEAIRVATAQIPGTLPTTPVSASSTASSMYSRTSTINRPSGSSPSSDSGSSQTEARQWRIQNLARGGSKTPRAKRAAKNSSGHAHFQYKLEVRTKDSR